MRTILLVGCLRRCRRGLALLELVVVLAVLVVLVSLLALGVQFARETTRRSVCSQHLRQIGLGLANYESAYNKLPAGAGVLAHGPLVSILPFIEQSQIYDQIDFNQDVDGNPITKTFRIPIYRCPSTPDQSTVRTDFILNRGTTLADERDDPWFYTERTHPNPAGYRNGRSGTALFSESASLESQNARLLQLNRRAIDTPIDSDQFVAECTAASVSVFSEVLENGQFWFGAGTMNYYHILPPNARSCANGGRWQKSLFSANSLHASGCNVLFADFRVELIHNQVDIESWRQIGSR